MLLTAFLCFSFVMLLLPDRWLNRFYCGDYENDLQRLLTLHDPAHSLLRLLNAALVVILPSAVLHPRKNLTRAAGIFGLASYPLNLLSVQTYWDHFQNYEYTIFGSFGRVFLTNPWFHMGLFCAAELLKLYLVLHILRRNRAQLHFEGLRDVLTFSGCAVWLLFVNMPITFPQQLCGTLTNIQLLPMNETNLLWLLWIAAEIVGLTLVFRKRNAEDRYNLLLILAAALLFQYNGFWGTIDTITPYRLPLQLCNIGCYILLPAVAFRKKGLCWMSLGINAFGALIAVFICDTPGQDGLFVPINIHYMVEHTKLIVIPVLMLTLGFLRPVRKKDYLLFLRAFSVYYLVAFAAGTFFNALKVIYDDFELRANYLFMFNQSNAEDILPALGVLFEHKISICTGVDLMPVQPLMYLVLGGLGTGIFFACYGLLRRRDNADIKR